MFDRAVITAKGLALDAKIIAGKTNAVFTAIRLGNGTYNGTEDLIAATAMKSVKQTFGISSISIAESNTVRLRSVINNVGIKEGYYISEVGIYAQDPDAGEILYSIALGIKNKMDYQPSESELEGATSTFDTYTVISNIEKATIRMGTGAMASAEDVEELQNDLGKVKERLDKLESNVTYYVATTGSDSNDGSQTKPFSSITKALSVIPKNLGGYAAAIKLADGSYGTTGFTFQKYYNGTFRIVGNEASPDKVIVPSSGICFSIIDNYAKFIVTGINFKAEGTNSGIWVGDTFSVAIYKCIIDGNQTGSGVVWRTSLLQITDTVFNNCLYCISSWNTTNEYTSNAIARMGSCTGTGNTRLARIEKGILQLIDDIMPEYTTEPTARSGAAVIKSSGAIVGTLQGNVSYNVSLSGSDSTGDGTSAKPFKTIQRALSVIPKDLNGYTATILIADGTYDEIVTISGFYSGTLDIKSLNNPETLNTLCKVRRIVIKNCSARVQVYGIYLTQTNDTALSVDTCNFVYVKCCQAIESAPSSFAFYFMYSAARVSGCKSINHINCINAFHSNISSETWAESSATEYGLLSNAGSKISKAGNQPSGTKGQEFTLSGGTIIDKSGTTSMSELREDTNIYVSTTGNDTTGNGSQANPFKTIKYALSLIPKNLGGYVADVYLADGTYNEDIDLRGYSGGILEFKSVSTPNSLNTVCRVKKVYASDCSARIRFYGLYLTLTNGDAFVMNNCATVFASSCQAIESGPDSCGFNISYSNVRLIACKSTNHQICCRAFFSEISSENWVSSSGSKYGLSIENCSIISKIGVQPTGTEANEYINDGGGIIINKNGDKIGTLQRNSSVTEITLKADCWDDGPAPYMQAVSIPGVTNDMQAMVLNALDDGATLAVQTAYNNAFRLITTGTGNIADSGPNIVGSGVSLWEGGSYNNIDGIKLAHASRIRTIQLVKVNPSTTYQFNVNSSVPSMFLGARAYDKNMNFVASYEAATEPQFIKTTGANEHYLGIIIWNSVDKFTSAEILAFIQNGSIKPYIGISGGSAIFKVYDKPATDIKIGLKSI